MYKYIIERAHARTNRHAYTNTRTHSHVNHHAHTLCHVQYIFWCSTYKVECVLSL